MGNLLWTLASSVYATKSVVANKLARGYWMGSASRRMQGARGKCGFSHLGPAVEHRKVVKPLRMLVDAFVNTFGITPPAPENEARAGRFIALMLGGVLALLVVVGLLVRSALSH
jgi:hypothetical protein